MSDFWYTSPDDGKTHINVYSKAKTYLGRLLSNWADTPFECEDGRFRSIEGYWYWLGSKDDRLRDVWGFPAKRLGREVGASDWIDTEEFKGKIKRAIRAKINQHKEIRKLLEESTLPLVHYYDYKGKIVRVPQGDWIMEELELIRQELKHGLHATTKP